MRSTKTVAVVGLLIAMNVVFNRFLTVQTDIVRGDFGFLPLAVSGMMFGPVVGGITGAVSDILGMMIWPRGAYFPGFTLSAALSGAVYGLFLHKKRITYAQTAIAAAVVIIFVYMGLNTLWVAMTTGNAMFAILPARAIKNILLFPIQVVTIKMVWEYAVKKVIDSRINY